MRCVPAWFSTLPLFLLAAGMGFSGCTPAEESSLSCPPVRIQPELASMEIKSSEKNEAVLVHAEIEGYRRSCRYTEDSVEITLQFKFRLTKGSAYNGEPVNLSYFAAVPAFYPSEQSRALVPLRAIIPAGRDSRDLVDDKVELILPRGESRSGIELEIVAGFQTSPAQLDQVWGNPVKPEEDKVPRKVVPRR